MNTSLRMAKSMPTLGVTLVHFLVRSPFSPLPPVTWQACAHFGATCSGTDIDVRVLKGRKGRNVFTNFGARVFSPGVLMRFCFSSFLLVLPPLLYWCAAVYWCSIRNHSLAVFFCREGTRLRSTVL